ncbi:sugar transferase [Saccharicrinis sp. GN24d3]|uniref:sugar transferase n=1 Tax=Saccharicrinis sp. GN24d3 TaxID=3458416 RepID=UPI0040374AF8
MPGIKEKESTKFKRIVDKEVALWHFAGDIIALILCHILFLGKYRLPYHEIFSPLIPVQIEHMSVAIAIATVIILWLFAFYISGHYSNPARKSGLQIIGPTAATCFIMSVLLFFMLDNYSPIELTTNAISLSLRYLFVVFVFTFSFRMAIISRLHHLIITGKRGYKKIFVGNNQQALEILKEQKDANALRQKFVGYLVEDNESGYDMTELIPCLGSVSDIEELVNLEDIDEAVVCLNQSHHETINHVINILKQKDILIKLSTNINQMLEGTVKTQNLESSPFITITNHKIPVWQGLAKRIFDFVMAWTGLIISTPLFIGIAIAIKNNSKGPVFYQQERIGKNKKPFMIYKFRSMYTDAEKNGPALASHNDPRITSVGKFIRKWRMDELPQLINIIMGDMSFVGPRPERQHFIDQILPKAPHYAHLFNVRPGITSWGMVKYGYAENVEEMIERLQYDILYLENRTLVIDFKIMLFTLRTILNGEGK